MSTWRSVSELRAFVYETLHKHYLARRREWFLPFEGVYTVLWWVPGGTEPTTDEAKERLAHLEAFGPSAHAFTLRQAFDPA